jgi:hypothetical protein
MAELEQLRHDITQKDSQVAYLLQENSDLRGQVEGIYGDVMSRIKRVASPTSKKRKSKRRRHEDTQVSKQSQDPKSDIKDILSEKMRTRQQQSLSKSVDRSYEKYQDISI